MLHPDKDPPTHTAYTQFRYRGEFREWHRDGKGWYEKLPSGLIIGRVFHMSGGPREFDGFIYLFPVGMPPPPPMLKPGDDPPTHAAWTQFRQQRKFRKWHGDGDGWVDETPDGRIISRVFHQSHGPLGFDGYIYLFPIGMQPPPSPADE